MMNFDKITARLLMTNRYIFLFRLLLSSFSPNHKNSKWQTPARKERRDQAMTEIRELQREARYAVIHDFTLEL